MPTKTTTRPQQDDASLEERYVDHWQEVKEAERKLLAARKAHAERMKRGARNSDRFPR